MKLTKTLFFAVTFVTTTQAAVNVTNVSFSGTTLSFDISGAIDPSDTPVGVNESNVLYVGAPSDTDWITEDVFGDDGVSLIFNNNGGGSLDITELLYFNGVGGDFIRLGTSAPAFLSGGDSVDASISITGSSLIAVNLDEADLIVTAGFNSLDTFPDPSVQVGAYVPEPAAYAMLLGLIGLGYVTVCRRR